MQTDAVYAKETQEYRAEADQYYQERNFTKAYKIYYKLAKKGDYHSQGQVSKMYAKGEYKKVNPTEAYAWSVLAAEGGDPELTGASEELLQRAPDQAAAQKKAESLKKKYGKLALEEKEARYAKRNINKPVNSCAGSRIACKNR